ncbi:MAG: hypothetical protein OXU20_19910 [Myxococcales bacterium]|nr:hypothetical protein [Myxococcales bacterium]MDD9970119.1 hypothetical protein [Myxococcales bacterium]
MVWIMDDSRILDAMTTVASDASKFAAFQKDPETYLTTSTDLTPHEIDLILREDRSKLMRALLSPAHSET